MRRTLSFALLLAAVLPGIVLPRPVAAATADVAIMSADIRSGTLLAGACYIIEGGSIEGCDENGDGRVEFAGVETGAYVVTQTRAPSGYLPAGDFPIDIESDGALFAAFLVRDSGGTDTVDIAVSAVDEFSREALPGACFLLHGGSEEGCDENGDGRVDFRDVRVGTYLVTQTRAPVGYLTPDDGWVAVTAAGARTLTVPTPRDNGQANVSIVSVDDQTGDRLIGACYVIQGGSIEGCDENGDGQVDFRDVAPGTYTVSETSTPSGYAPVGDFGITVPRAGSAAFTVRHAAAALADVAIVSRDAASGARLPGACYVIEGGSIEGCDENGDGQVDFRGVVPGRYDVTETKPPAGYRAVPNLTISVLGGTGDVEEITVDHG